MQPLNCLIIEDEPLAADVLRDYINDVPNLHLVAICRDALTATTYLHEHQINVLFIDIHLPKLNGIEFIKTLGGNYSIILTTAYHQYALEGFNLNVVDYLLKPIEFSRFLQAINKVLLLQKSIQSTENRSITNHFASSENDFHFFNIDKKQVKIFFNEILYIESLKDYVRIHTTNKKWVTKLQLGEMETLLQGKNFLRVHKSFIVNLDKMTAYGAAEIEIEAVKIPIGRTYKGLL
jgi:DNA-binding LytR/AlgR family response regulator